LPASLVGFASPPSTVSPWKFRNSPPQAQAVRKFSPEKKGKGGKDAQAQNEAGKENDLTEN